MKFSKADAFILESLQSRKEANTLRELRPDSGLKDFSSNDYLGIAHSGLLNQEFLDALASSPNFKMGSGGSRLLSGNDKFTENLEKEIAAFHQAESGLIFNSGYDANVGLFSSLPQKGDTIITDELIHASIIDGARLSHASRFIFKHNDCESLEKKLKQATGRIYIGVESIYSMDGDEAPLTDIALLAEKYNAALIVDEAHAIGVFGSKGEGIVCELGLTDRVFARTITFGKALGTHGSAIIGSEILRNYLINFARSFIYTTAASFTSHLSVQLAYKLLQSQPHFQSDLTTRIKFFQQAITIKNRLIPSRSAIQSLLMKDAEEAKKIANICQTSGFDLRPILTPTVPSGKERIRVCIHNHNSTKDIKQLCSLLNELLS